MTGLAKGKKFSLDLDDDANIIKALAIVDKYISEHPQESIFPLFKDYIYNYLQLVWNPESNMIYDDIALNAYGPNEKGELRVFMPIKGNPNYNLHPNSVIDIQLDAGC